LAVSPRLSDEIRACHDAALHYAPHLRTIERQRFEGLLQGLSDGSVRLHEARKAVQVWAVRYDKTFVRSHSFFRPYPGILCDG
ncbi:MAG: DUF1722 domain-containing protein, partial [candidate division Zixibacteria bacterium]|nr:DUF1722 domain-containing protein [candidate division Zixibacteria bacterium]